MSALDFVDRVLARQYFAAVIGPFRAPFGSRASFPLNAGEQAQLQRNTTREHVLFVTVSRGDVAGPAASVIFSRNEQGSTNDFTTSFTSGAIQRFILRPDESVAITVTAAGGLIPFVVATETY